jgi:hypothetical protein
MQTNVYKANKVYMDELAPIIKQKCLCGHFLST